MNQKTEEGYNRDILRALSKGDPILTPELVTITNPVHEGTVAVTEYYPGSCSGYISASGTAEKPGWNLAGSSVLVSVNNGSPRSVTVQADHTWSIASIEGATCPCSGTNSNQLKVQANWYRFGMTGMQTLIESATHTFTGDCSGRAESREQRVRTQERRPAEAAHVLLAGDEELVEPLPLENGWFEYRGLLSPSPFQYGKVLGLYGQPLAARVIAVYASHVLWYNHGQTGIRRAMGSLGDPDTGIDLGGVILFREPYRFLDLLKETICVFQPGGVSSSLAETRYAVVSECGDKPDVFDVQPDQPILTRVNDSFIPPALHTGTYNLRVKVLA